jgi:hypothetical protein
VLVKRVVEAHGGRVDVRSTPGKGTDVTFVLPRAAAPAAPTEDIGASPLRPPRRVVGPMRARPPSSASKARS